MAAFEGTIRPLQPSDLRALRDLCANSLHLDRFEIEDLQRRIFDDPRHQPDLSLAAEKNGRLVGSAIGVLEDFRDLHVGRIKLWAVDPAFRGQGLGATLLGMLEERFAAAGAVQVTTLGAPHYLYPGVDVRYTQALCTLERRGYELGDWTQNMEMDLTGQRFDISQAEASLQKASLTIERLPKEQLDEVADFAGQFNPIWTEELQFPMSTDPFPVFAARRAGKMVAFAGYDFVSKRGTFGPMGTEPSLRGKGLGSVLLRRCLADMQARGYPRCDICWVGPVAFHSCAVGACICRVFRDPWKSLKAQSEPLAG